jgi:hypothetical protein
MILWRPVGLLEMALVFESGMRAFPARLAHQPIFYPVLTREYAEAIARDWNTKEEPYSGYVLRMKLADRYATKFPPQTAGSAAHRELWVPAEELVEFNSNLSGIIAVERAFFGPKFTGYVPEEFGLPGCDAFRQIAMMIATAESSTFDFRREVSANATAVFLNFPFWKAAGAGRLNVEPLRLERCLEAIREAWSVAPRPAALLENATCTD